MRDGALDNITGADQKVISVITATFNAIDHLPALIESLRQQTYKTFEWVVSDGGSTDGTVELLQSITDLNVNVFSASDFGIYDALNNGIKAAASEYYVVAGADDIFYPNAMADYAAAVATAPDMVAACISVGGQVVKPGRGSSWLYGQFEFIAGHSVGTLIKKTLHQTFGYYSNKFPIAADQLFIKKCCQADIVLVKTNWVAGEFGQDGVSSVDVAGVLSEFFRVQLRTEKNRSLQVVIYILRLLRHCSRL